MLAYVIVFKARLRIVPRARLRWSVAGAVALIVVFGFITTTRAGSASSEVQELGDGFVVEPGSQLVGTVFPLVPNGAEVEAPNGWTAHLNVEGNPVSVINRYLNRAQSLGYSTAVSCHLAYAEKRRDASVDLREVPLSAMSPDPHGLRELRCAATANPPAGDSNDQLMLQLTRSAGATAYANELTLRHGPASSIVDPGPEPGAPTLIPNGYRHGVPAVPDRPEMPSVGEPIERDMTPPRFTVQSGSRVLARNPDSCSGERTSVAAVLDVTGARKRVIDRYAREFSRRIAPAEQQPGTFRGEPVVVVTASRDADTARLIVVGATHPHAELVSCTR